MVITRTTSQVTDSKSEAKVKDLEANLKDSQLVLRLRLCA